MEYKGISTTQCGFWALHIPIVWEFIYSVIYNHSSSVKKVKLSWLWLFSCSKNHQFSSRYVKIRYQYDVDSSLWMDANSFFFLPIVPRSSRNKLISCERRFNDFFGLSCTQCAASSTASWMRLRLLPLRSFFLPLNAVSFFNRVTL